MDKPKILVTNDDGIHSNGIKALIEVAKEFGKVYVVAPNKPQSGMGHAITLTEPLRLFKVNDFGEDVVAYKCTGTPVDCVKIAIDKVLEEPPILCLSGINHGSNSSINVIYSGTMSAAMEAAIEGVNSIGFSNVNFSSSASLETAKAVARVLVKNVLENGMPDTKLLNVNIPDVSLEHLKGIKLCKQANGYWKEDFVKRKDPIGKNYYWMTGKFQLKEKDESSDIWALEHNYVSVVPVKHDLTDYNGLDFLKDKWNLNVKG